MKVTLDVKPWELEPDDTIAGMPAKALVAFAATVKKAGITDDDLKQFMKDVDRLNEIIRKEYDLALKNSIWAVL